VTDRQAELEQKQFRLKLEYARGLDDRLDEMGRRWLSLQGEWDRLIAEELYRSIHSLCGSAGTYEAAAIARHARDAEQAILTIIYNERSPTREEVETLDQLLRRVTKSVNNWEAKVEKEYETRQQSAANDTLVPRVYILEEELLAVPLSKELHSQGIISEVFSSVEELEKQLDGTGPVIIVADRQKVAAKAGQLASGKTRKVLLIILSEQDTQQARLESARCGAYRFFLKPLDLSKLVREIRRASFSSGAAAYHILIVDDDVTLSQLNSQILQAAGMQTRVVNKPLEAVEDMEDFQPDLVLMDVHMPDVSGPELAAMLGQDYRFANIPILFLSADSNIEKTLNELHLAGEDYLSKPVEPQWLVASVEARVRKRFDLLQAQDDYAKAANESRYRELALNEHAIVSVADAAGVITYVNKKFCDISGYQEEDLLGQDHNIINSGVHSREYFEQMWETITNGRVWHGELCNVRRDGQRYWVASTIVPFLDNSGLPYQYVSIRTDITPIKSLEREVSRHGELLDALHEAMTGFMSAGQFNKVASTLLTSILGLTKSQYGLMAEVLFSDDQPVFIAHAISNTLWNQSASEKFQLEITGGRPLEQDTELLRTITQSGESLIVGNLSPKEHGDRLPGGDDHLRKLIAVPVFYGDQLVGLYALARSETDYSENILSFLDAFNSAYGVMIHAKRIAEMEVEVTQYLEQARSDAESANRAKSEFLSSMSHELRTPLNVIMGFAQLMTADDQLGESNRENAEEILRAGRHLLDLVNEILDLSRIEAGQLELDMRSVEVVTAIAESVALIAPLASEKNIEIVFDRKGLDRQHVVADSTRLNQALINLLSNAVKYTPDGGQVKITCEKQPEEMMRIIVNDSGPGISDDYVNQLFTSFNRLDASPKTEGTGIGLVITRSLVDAMGGNVGYDRSDLGGASFWLELPIDRDEGKELVFSIQAEQTSGVEHIADAENRHALLYIEDNLANLNLVKQLVARRDDIVLLTAQEPEEGLRLIENNELDAVLLDINLPVMSGFEVLACIRDSEQTRNLPVIALSANAMPEDIQRGLDAGFDDYITKPIQIDQFFEALDRILQPANS